MSKDWDSLSRKERRCTEYSWNARTKKEDWNESLITSVLS